MNAFHFKQFTVNHEACAMKVGTDSVLLGAWADCEKAHRILDVGTGSGILALMAAQRNPYAEIVGIDIDPSAVQQANANAALSPWNGRIHMEQADIRSWVHPSYFDCILCNPPFYHNGLLSPDALRNQARQTASLSFEDLIKGCAALLTDNGTFHVIIPSENCDFFCQLCWERNLHLQRKVWVHTKENKQSKRVLLSFSKKKCPYPMGERLILKNKDNEVSEDYRKLTGDFYLKF